MIDVYEMIIAAESSRNGRRGRGKAEATRKLIAACREVLDEIERYIDRDAWDRAIEVEAAEVESMREFHERWRGSISGQADKYRGTQP